MSLEQARIAKDIAECRRRIDMQIVWIEQLRRAGQDSPAARKQLDELRDTLQRLRLHGPSALTPRVAKSPTSIFAKLKR